MPKYEITFDLGPIYQVVAANEDAAYETAIENLKDDAYDLDYKLIKIKSRKGKWPE